MLSITPRFDNKKYAYNQRMSPKSSTQNYAAAINFKKYVPDDANKVVIDQIQSLVASPKVERILIGMHDNVDGDCTGSAIALSKFIKNVTGKFVDIFTTSPLPKKFEFLNKDKDITVLNSNDYSNMTGEHLQKILRNKFGQHDLAILLDTPHESYMNPFILENFYMPSEYKVFIDHHPEVKRDLPTDITFIDDKKESNAQLIMQFADGYGYSEENIPKNITDALLTGIITDSQKLTLARNHKIFNDVKSLAKTSNYKEIADKATQISPQDVVLASKILGDNIQFTDNKIAYLLYDHAKYPGANTDTARIILELFQKMSDIDYYFGIHTNSLNPNWANIITVRSKKNPVNVLSEFEARGHKHSKTIRTNQLPPEQLRDRIINDLSKSQTNRRDM